MRCPCCGHDGMLFESHHGMEQNVCEQCGSVVESENYVADPFQPGLREVPFTYQCQQNSSKDLLLLNPKSKPLAESYEVMCQLMDRLNLPMAARELAVYFLQHSRNFDKRSSVGASVYLSMKRHDIPVTLKYISNYLQVSHFSVGRVMKGLERRIGPASQGHAFAVHRLPLLIFSQAQFGGRRQLDVFLGKTERLLLLVHKCPLSVSYQPHIIILAAGFLVWRSLNHWGWPCPEAEGVGGQESERRRRGRHGETLRGYLGEVGVRLSDHSSVYAKINLICSLLHRLAAHIPWLSACSKDDLHARLDDLLEYGPPVAASVQASDFKVEWEGYEEPAGRTGPAARDGDEEEEGGTRVAEECKMAAAGGAEGAVGGQGGSSGPLAAGSAACSRRRVEQTPPPEFRRVRFTKVKRLRGVGDSGARWLKAECCDGQAVDSGCDQVVACPAPVAGKDYPSCLDFP